MQYDVFMHYVLMVAPCGISLHRCKNVQIKIKNVKNVKK